MINIYYRQYRIVSTSKKNKIQLDSDFNKKQVDGGSII